MRTSLRAGMGRWQQSVIASFPTPRHKDSSLDSKLGLGSSSCQVIYWSIVQLAQIEAPTFLGYRQPFGGHGQRPMVNQGTIDHGLNRSFHASLYRGFAVARQRYQAYYL